MEVPCLGSAILGYGTSQKSHNLTSADKLYFWVLHISSTCLFFSFLLPVECQEAWVSFSCWIIRHPAPFVLSTGCANYRHEGVHWVSSVSVPLVDKGRCLSEPVVGITVHVVKTWLCEGPKPHCCGLSCKGSKSLQACIQRNLLCKRISLLLK